MATKTQWMPDGWHNTVETLGNSVQLRLWNQLRDAYPTHQLVCFTDRLNMIKYLAEHQLIPSEDAGTFAAGQHSEIHFERKAAVNTWSIKDILIPQDAQFDVTYQGVLIHLFVTTIFTPGNPPTEVWYLLFESDDDSPARRLLTDIWRWEGTSNRELWVYNKGTFAKSGKLYSDVMQGSKEDLILPPKVLDRLRRDTLTFFSSKKVYRSLDVPWKRGLLLMGPPGNGKTATIKTVIRDCADRVTVIYARQLKDCGGSYANGITALFERARASAPCLLVLEDIDSLVDPKARAFLLNELDGFEANDGVLILATTNHAAELDDALLNRPSRFDQKYVFDLPDFELREQYIAKWLQKRIGLDRLDFSDAPADENGNKIDDLAGLATALARRTEGWSFAFLKELFVSYLLRLAAKLVTDVVEVDELKDKTDIEEQQLDVELLFLKASVAILFEQVADLASQVKQSDTKSRNEKSAAKKK